MMNLHVQMGNALASIMFVMENRTAVMQEMKSDVFKVDSHFMASQQSQVSL